MKFYSNEIRKLCWVDGRVGFSLGDHYVYRDFVGPLMIIFKDTSMKQQALYLGFYSKDEYMCLVSEDAIKDIIEG